MKKTRDFVSVMILIVFVALAFGSTESDSSSSGAASSGPASGGSANAPSPPNSPSETVAAIGDTIVFGDSEWVVLSAEDLGSTLSSGNRFVENATTPGKFVRVTFRVTNKQTQEERILQVPEIRDAQGRTFRNFDRASMYLADGQSTMIMEALPASMPKEFTEIYEVPADATGIVFLAREISSFVPDTRAVALGF